MVLAGGIEPPTSSLPMRCSTPELRQRKAETLRVTLRLLRINTSHIVISPFGPNGLHWRGPMVNPSITKGVLYALCACFCLLVQRNASGCVHILPPHNVAVSLRGRVSRQGSTIQLKGKREMGLEVTDGEIIRAIECVMENVALTNKAKTELARELSKLRARRDLRISQIISD